MKQYLIYKEIISTADDVLQDRWMVVYAYLNPYDGRLYQGYSAGGG